ncbi:MAG: SAM-dependent chlorinase/fluorinase, partial [Deltaproteobacteria bacterium]|nr:SAM-dependent chlorinase/fluorinase [Deltaproteobacteria bacterium]
MDSVTSRPIITLLTDFGCRDAYAAAMKGVILGINPQVCLVDLTHEIPPHDIAAAAFVLAEAAPFFPPETIHLAVVDPGVGSARRGLAARARGQFCIGPDNGLFHFLFQGAPDLAIFSLENPAYFLSEISATFHGRDIFAPVAAHLSRGLALEKLGPVVDDPVVLPVAEPVFGRDRAEGEIVYVDRFGNLVSNINWQRLSDWLNGSEVRLELGSLTLNRLSR